MNRLTQKRVNGIKTGYWSASKKDELVARLAEYEDTGLEPEEVLRLKKDMPGLIPVTEKLPKEDAWVLVAVKRHHWISDFGEENIRNITNQYITSNGIARFKKAHGVR